MADLLVDPRRLNPGAGYYDSATQAITQTVVVDGKSVDVTYTLEEFRQLIDFQDDMPPNKSKRHKYQYVTPASSLSLHERLRFFTVLKARRAYRDANPARFKRDRQIKKALTEQKSLTLW